MTSSSPRPRHHCTTNANERWGSSSMIVTRFCGIISSPTFNRQLRSHRDHISKGEPSQSSQSRRQRRKAADTNMGMGIGLTEHMPTEHTLDLDGTVCKNYLDLEPQDARGISPQDSTISHICVEPQAQGQGQDKVLAIALSKLAGMIKERDWDVLVTELRAHESEELSEGVEKGLLLHLALRFDAPLHIITELTHDADTSASHRDAKGRLPLHVSIRNVSQLSIVSHVLMLNPEACTSLDDQGSIPLHFCFDENVMNAFKPSQFRELIRTLIQNSPESLMMEDRDGRCPLELAILSDAPLKTILLMQLSKYNYLRQKHQQNQLIGSASCIEKTVMLKDNMSSRHAAGRIGVTMFG